MSLTVSKPQISTHTPLARRDLLIAIFTKKAWNFYSHASCEARQNLLIGKSKSMRFLLTRLLRGATILSSFCLLSNQISTHTPLARRDEAEEEAFAAYIDFYSHASCEARPYCLGALERVKRFLLTRLLRGATIICTLRMIMAQFLLTRLLRGATYGIEPQSRQTIISTHTPLARRDVLVVMKQMLLSHFYSHASCEARRLQRQGCMIFLKFLLTRLLRGATCLHLV